MKLTLPEINLLAQVQGEQQAIDHENQIYYLHLAGNLNAFAYHEPKKYPKLKTLLPKNSSIKEAEAREDQAMRKQAAKLGLRVPK
jgi:hypothetical protein